MTFQTRSMCLLVKVEILLVGVLHDLVHADLLRAELVAQLEDLLDRDRGAQHHLQHAPFALFDALGDLNLTSAAKERDRAHLAQIQSHRINGRGITVGVLPLLGLVFLASTSSPFSSLGFTSLLVGMIPKPARPAVSGRTRRTASDVP